MLKSIRLSALASATALFGLSACTHLTDPEIASFGDREAVTPSQSADSYYVSAAAAIQSKLEKRDVKPAKNVILFIGDGMGISTITAARIYAGQQKGVDGESYHLAMDSLPYSALSKTYSHDSQIADSAATATAMTTGVKVPGRTLGLTQDAKYGNCASAEATGTDSLWEIAEEQGLATGIVSTARITHATPAATYSESASRNWEDNTEVEDGDCADIARQLIEWDHGDGFEIVLGGGRQHLMPADVSDPEYPNKGGRRTDGRNLIEEWNEKSDAHVFVYDQAGFDAIDFASDKHVMGLFEPSHMQYTLDREEDGAGEPSIAQMTEAAITRLRQNDKGYLLMVEGGRVDHGHHGGNAARALSDAVALDEAVAKALEMTSDEDTLILVTADHSHTMTISGYSQRNNPILGLSSYGFTPNTGADGKPYTTLGYANGPGAVCGEGDGDAEAGCARSNLSKQDTTQKNFMQQATVPMASETHAGEDVALLAGGPGSNLVSGVMEENEIFHVIGKSLGLLD
ncbi:alkaline phosphatase [Hirschia litorea]|uniref:Alkaline phosphatase n=1 Tax=Hirschia litorea TaxID=1199156 RepID=A0ABW2IJC1_9PROT